MVDRLDTRYLDGKRRLEGRSVDYRIKSWLRVALVKVRLEVSSEWCG